VSIRKSQFCTFDFRNGNIDSLINGGRLRWFFTFKLLYFDLMLHFALNRTDWVLRVLTEQICCISTHNAPTELSSHNFEFIYQIRCLRTIFSALWHRVQRDTIFKLYLSIARCAGLLLVLVFRNDLDPLFVKGNIIDHHGY